MLGTISATEGGTRSRQCRSAQARVHTNRAGSRRHCRCLTIAVVKVVPLGRGHTRFAARGGWLHRPGDPRAAPRDADVTGRATASVGHRTAASRGETDGGPHPLSRCPGTIASTTAASSCRLCLCHGSSREAALPLRGEAVALSRGYCFQGKESPAGSAAGVATSSRKSDESSSAAAAGSFVPPGLRIVRAMQSSRRARRDC
jgi:hypothetical protein